MESSLLKLISADLSSDDKNRHEEAIGAIYWVADIFIFGGEVKDLNESTPYFEEIIKTDINEELLNKLKELLRKHISRNPNASISSAISTLGKFFDKNDIPLFTESLDKALVEILEANAKLHQTIIALNNLEEITPGDGSLSILDTEKNIELARAYLKQHGKVYPW